MEMCSEYHRSDIHGMSNVESRGHAKALRKPSRDDRMTIPRFQKFLGDCRPAAPLSYPVECDGRVILTGQMPADPGAPDALLPEGIEAQSRRAVKHDNIPL